MKYKGNGHWETSNDWDFHRNGKTRTTVKPAAPQRLQEEKKKE